MAYYLNRAMIIGNVTRDPESRQLPSGQSVCNFSVATNRSFADKDGNKRDDVEYHNCVAWGKLAEICQQYLGKGRKVYVEGRLQTRSWEGQDSIQRSRTEMVVEQMIMLDRGGAQGQGSAQQFDSQQQDQFGGKQPQFSPNATSSAQQTHASQAPQVPELPTISYDEESAMGNEIRIEDIPF